MSGEKSSPESESSWHSTMHIPGEPGEPLIEEDPEVRKFISWPPETYRKNEPDVERKIPVPRMSQQTVQKEHNAIMYGAGYLDEVEEDKDIFCTPTSAIMLAEGMGYELPSSHQLDGHDWVQTKREWAAAKISKDYFSSKGWSRPGLSDFLRKEFHSQGIRVVSWQMGRNNDESLRQPNFEAMIDRGYLRTDEEIEAFRSLKDVSLKEIVQSGLPVMVTVKGGFAAGSNGDTHTIVIDGWNDHGLVHVVDSNDKDPWEVFTEQYIDEFLDPDGACTVILPRSIDREDLHHAAAA